MSRRLSPTGRFRRYVGTSRLSQWTPPRSASVCMGRGHAKPSKPKVRHYFLVSRSLQLATLIGDVLLVWSSAEHRGGRSAMSFTPPTLVRGTPPRPRTGSCIWPSTISAFTASSPGSMPTITVQLVSLPGSACGKRHTSCETSGSRAAGATSWTSPSSKMNGVRCATTAVSRTRRTERIQRSNRESARTPPDVRLIS